MKLRRSVAAVAAVAAGALVLSACSTPEADDAIEETQSVSVGWNEPFRSTNNLTPSGNGTTNANVIYMTTSRFVDYNADLELVRNESFGTYEVLTEDPFTVKYTINEGVVWSDGTPVDAADMILYWGAQSSQFDTTTDDLEYDDEGNAIVPEGQVHIAFPDEIMNAVTKFPEIGDDGRSVTLVFDKPRADWEVGMGSGPSRVAAHAVADIALGIEDPTEAKQALIDAFKNNDSAALSKIMDTFTNGFNFSSMPDDPRLYLSNGPMIISEFVENQFLTVVRNEKYTGQYVPKVDSITIRYSEDPLASVTALQNGEVDLIAPQSSVDVLATLEGMEGVSFTTNIEGSFEHVDLTFDNGGPFDPATYGDPADPAAQDKARMVRQAFLMTIPRQEIIDKLIKPLQEDAVTRNSFLQVPGAPGYEEIAASNGMRAFDEVDIEGAKALLEQAGVTTPVDVRFLYGASNVRRANQFELISASAALAGFNVVDNGDDNWGSRLGDGTYDASLFAWQSTNTFMLNSQANFFTGGPNNFGGYSDPEMDALWNEAAVTTDDARNQELAEQIEVILMRDAFGLTLFQFPGVVAHRDVLQNASTMTLSPTIFYNFYEWELSGN